MSKQARSATPDELPDGTEAAAFNAWWDGENTGLRSAYRMCAWNAWLARSKLSSADRESSPDVGMVNSMTGRGSATGANACVASSAILSMTLLKECVEQRYFDQAIGCTQGQYPMIAARLREWLDHARADLNEGRLVASSTTEFSVPKGWRLIKDATHDERRWKEDGGHENGNYYNECLACGRGFIGHKRRAVCKACSETPVLCGGETFASSASRSYTEVPRDDYEYAYVMGFVQTHNERTKNVYVLTDMGKLLKLALPPLPAEDHRADSKGVDRG